MAKVNPVKLKQDADKLEKAGKIEQSIALYRQIVEDSPRDWNTINKVGDLLAKLNKFQEANEEYAKVADFYAKDGFHLKAIAIWKKINKLDPSALGPYVNLAELYAKQGLMMEAKGQYQIVVEEYIKRGKMKDAGEVLRKMAEIDPADLKVRSKLADLYTREGNIARAVEEHVAIAEELSRKGHLSEAVQVLEKGLKIDPRGLRLRVELGRVHVVQKNFERAAQTLEEAAQLAPNDPQVLARLGEACLGAGRVDEAERLFARLLGQNPDDAEARVQMGRVRLAQRRHDEALDEFAPLIERHVARREGDAAASLLQEIVQHEPTHVKTLVKLAEVHRLLKQDSAVAATYSQLTEAYLHAGQYDQAIGVLETLVSMEPYNQQHKTKLQFVRDKRAGAGGAAAPEPPPVESGLEEEFDLGIASDDDFPDLAPAAPPARRAPPATTPTPMAVPAAASPAAGPAGPRIELSGPLSDQDREFVDEHMAEGKVFRKYGLVEKAADQFEAVVARFPDHAEARQELRDVYKEKGQLARAAEQSRALSEIARLKGDRAGAELHATQARELQPAAPVTAPVPIVAARPPAPPPPPPPPLESEDIPLVLEEAEPPLDVEEEMSLGLEAEAGSETDELPEHFLDEEEEQAEEQSPLTSRSGEIDVALTFGEPEAEDEAPAAVAAPDDPPFDLAGDEPEADAPAEEEAGFDFPFEEEEAAPPVPPPPPPPLERPAPLRAAAPPAPAPPVSRLPSDVQRVLDEVDEYMSLGFVDDARDALAEIAQRHPREPLVLAKMAELGMDAATDLATDTAVEDEIPLARESADLPLPVLRDAPSPAFDDLADALDVSVEDEPEAPAEPEAPLGAELDLDLDLPASPETAAEPPSFADELEFPGLDTGWPSSPPAAEPELDEPEPLAASASHAPPESVEDMLADMDVLPDVAPPTPEFDDEPEAEDADSPLSALEEAVHSSAASSATLDLGAELFGAIAAVREPEPQAPVSEMGDSGLADIFREFKKGVDRQLGQEDYDTRYNLGIAYKEMGLVDEAIAEFQLAAKDPGRLLECSSMLGICFLDKGMPKLAVKWFEKGLLAPGRSDEEYQGLRYDLACAYEADGDAERARGLFADLFGQDAGFRDVAERLRALSGR